MPKEKRDSIEQRDEITGFLFNQSHISKKNMGRLKVLASSPNRETAELAELVLEVAKLAPYRKRHFKVLAAQDVSLRARLEAAGFLPETLESFYDKYEYYAEDEYYPEGEYYAEDEYYAEGQYYAKGENDEPVDFDFPWDES